MNEEHGFVETEGEPVPRYEVVDGEWVRVFPWLSRGPAPRCSPGCVPPLGDPDCPVHGFKATERKPYAPV